MNNRKPGLRTLGLAAGFVAVVGLAGCGSDKQATSAPPPAATVPPPAPMPAPAPPVQSTPRLMPGQHPRIAQIQMALNSNGAQLQVDGRDGPKTKAALRAFQRQHNLKITGRPDDATAKALGV